MAYRPMTSWNRAGAVVPAALVLLTLVGQAPAEERSSTRPIQFEGKGCTSTGCHDTLTKPKYLHGPVVVSACQRCHQETDRVNHKYRLVADAPGLCFACHAKLHSKLQNTSLHPLHHKPVDEGRCLDCHNPHSSGHPKMLRKDSIIDLCLSCHKEPIGQVKKISLVGHVHKAVEQKGCLECHRGHDSDNTKLLRYPRQVLCLRCHDDKYQESVGLRSVHKPFLEKNCVGCHNPHSSPTEKLLAKPLRTALYGPFDEQSYALCFSCHKHDLVINPVTTQDTNFRNGDKNLHYLHVDKESKGRGCRICHLPHGSPQSRLIRPMVPFRNWKLKIHYTPTETGGFCGPACHSAKRYDRLVPIDFTQEPARPDVNRPNVNRGK